MIDIVIRDCGAVGHLPIIIVTETQEELYRGSHHESASDAFKKAQRVWFENQTQNIIDFKKRSCLGGYTQDDITRLLEGEGDEAWAVSVTKHAETCALCSKRINESYDDGEDAEVAEAVRRWKIAEKKP